MDVLDSILGAFVPVHPDGFKFVAGAGLATLILFALTPPLGWNSWNVWGGSVDDAKVRGELRGNIFTARSIWPQDWAIDETKLTLAPPLADESLLSMVRRHENARNETFEARLLWERTSPATPAARDWSGRAVIGIMLSITLPNFAKARTTAQMNACIKNLVVLDQTKQQWGFETKQQPTATPTVGQIRAYFGQRRMPVCPSRGTYTLQRLDRNPTCTLAGLGHTL